MSCILLKMEDFLTMKPEGYQKCYTTTSEIYKAHTVVAEGPRHALFHLKSCRLLQNCTKKIALEKACKIGE